MESRLFKPGVVPQTTTTRPHLFIPGLPVTQTQPHPPTFQMQQQMQKPTPPKLETQKQEITKPPELETTPSFITPPEKPTLSQASKDFVPDVKISQGLTQPQIFELPGARQDDGSFKAGL